MNRYVKINNSKIIKIFTWFNRPEFDGNEILFDNNFPAQGLKINNKEILTEYGFPVFNWDGENAIEKTQNEIDSDTDFIIFYKQLKKDELQAYIGLHTLDILNNHTWTEIVNQWNNFKTNSSNWTTKQDIDNAFNTAINWLNT